LPYLLIDDFRLGVDRTRPQYAGLKGSIWTGINGHISSGGDFEVRKAFSLTYTNPPGTFGLAATADGIMVFGSVADPGVPSGVTYQRLQHEDNATAMSEILDAELYNGKPYVCAKYTDGEIFQFYDGTRITDWDDGRATLAMQNATGIAVHLAALVNRDGGGTYTATSVGAVVTVTKTTGNFDTATSVLAGTLNLAGGTDDQTAVVAYTHPAATATITIAGTFEVGDQFYINLEGNYFGYFNNPTRRGTVAKTLQRKVYVGGGPELAFTGVDTATGFTVGTDTGAGQINMSNHIAGSEELIALAVYQAKLAVFSRNAVQIWVMTADPVNNYQDQVLQRIGTRARNSAISYHEHDVFFLAESGIRSIRAQQYLTTAGVEDVGTPIDPYLLEYLLTLTDTQIANAVAIVEPTNGSFWLAVGTKIFVYSYFPSKKISAWTWYEPGFEIRHMAVYGGQVYARSGDKIYRYGGADGATYESLTATLIMPFLTGDRPAHFKHWTGVDASTEGSWELTLLVDPNDVNVEEHIGTVSGVTFPEVGSPHLGHHTHIAPKLVFTGATAAKVSQLALHYQAADSRGGTK